MKLGMTLLFRMLVRAGMLIVPGKFSVTGLKTFCVSLTLLRCLGVPIGCL